MQNKFFRYIVLFAALSSVFDAAGDEARCDEEHNSLLASIARDREAKVVAIEQAIAATNDLVEQEHLRWQIEQGWDEEERLRAIAGHIWRDCVRAVRNQN